MIRMKYCRPIASPGMQLTGKKSVVVGRDEPDLHLHRDVSNKAGSRTSEVLR